MPPVAPHVALAVRQVDPAEALVQRIGRLGVLPGVGRRVRHLFEEPVLAVIASADRIGHVVREEVAVAQRPAPQPVFVPLVKLVAGPAGITDLPDLLAITHRLPVELAQVDVLARLDIDIGLGVFAEDTVGKGMQGIVARPDIVDRKAAVVRTLRPELIVVAIVRPGHGRAGAITHLVTTGVALIIRMGQADLQVWQSLASGLRIVEHQLAADRGALGPVRIIDAFHPVIGPGRLDRRRLGHGVVPQGQGVVAPGLGHGRRARTIGGLQSRKLASRGFLGAIQGIEIDEDGADDVAPLLALRNMITGAAGIVAAGPVVEQGAAHMVDQVELLGAAADIFAGRIDEVDADMVLGRRPAPSLQLVHHRVVAVFMLDRVLVEARGQDALFLGVDDHPGAQVVVTGHQHIAVVVDAQPVEALVHRLQDEAVLAEARRRIGGVVDVFGIGIKAGGSAL